MKQSGAPKNIFSESNIFSPTKLTISGILYLSMFENEENQANRPI